MRILFVGYHNPYFISITEYVERAIENLGHVLLSFDDRKFIIPGRIRDRIPFLEHLDLARINKQLLSFAIEHEPDICLVSGGHRIFSKTIKELKALGIKTVLWTIDAPAQFEAIINSAPEYDFVFCGGTEARVILKRFGIKKTYWLPFACEPNIHKPVTISKEERERYEKDVAFIGSFYPSRFKILEELSELDLGVWGPGWENIPQDSPLKKHIYPGNLQPEEWLKIYTAAKIVIVVHYQDEKILCYQASPKVYEILACEKFLLCDKQKDVERLFEDRKHLVIFKDIEDLKHKIFYYLKHLKERRAIAEAGFTEVIEKHTYENRITELINIVAGS